MTLTNLALIVVGVGVMALGFLRARIPWQRYQALKAQEENIARYESWRGGLRDDGPTGASVARDLARQQARNWGLIIGVGLLIAVFGLVTR
jgi:hypothetical protein